MIDTDLPQPCSHGICLDSPDGCRFGPDGDVPHHRALGLVEYVAARIRKQITDDDPSEEDR